MNQQGSKNNHAKLDETDVMLIKHLLRIKIKRKDIAVIFVVSKGTIDAIAEGRRWPHVKAR